MTPVDKSLSAEAALRQAALKAMGKFADQNHVTNRDWEERDLGDEVRFMGTADDGRQFSIGYRKAAA